MTTVAVTYTIDERRFMRACHALWAYRAIGQWGNYMLAAFVTACGAFLLWQGVPGPWAYVLFAGVAVFIIMNLLRDRLWCRYYHTAEKYRAPITATVGADGASVDSAEGVHTQPWSLFRSFAVTDEFLFIIIDQRQFSVIPLDAFENQTQAAAFEAVLVDHLKRLPRRRL